MSTNKNITIKKNWFIQSHEGDIRDHYNVNLTHDVIGAGSFANVVRGTTKEGNIERAIKILPKRKIADVEKFKLEIDILKNTDHPNIIKLVETFEDDKNIYVITEICKGGEVFDRIINNGRLTESEARHLFTQLVQALNYCHSHGICHRDIKPENFLYLDNSPDSCIKLIDFGFAAKFDNPGGPRDGTSKVLEAKVGTSYYIAPEVLSGAYDEACDMWSAGVVLYITLCGYPPFNGNTDFKILEKVKKQVYDFEGPEWKEVSGYAINLIKSLLCPAKHRMTATQVLKHPWMLEGAKKDEKPLNLNYASLKNFIGAAKFKKAALTAIASRLSENEIEELLKQFKRLDKDGKGVLSFEEMQAGLRELNNKRIMDIDTVLETVDTDKSGTIDYTEFIAATMDRNLYLKEEKLLDAFMVFDTDKTGKITASDLKEVLGNDSNKQDMRVFEQMIREVDTDGDGVVL